MLSRRSVLAAVGAVLASSPLAAATGPPDGTYIAVLDRFEAGADQRLAVLMLEEGGEPAGRLVVAATALPERARHADAVLEVVVRDGHLERARYLPGETERRAERSQARFDRLAHGRCGRE